MSHWTPKFAFGFYSLMLTSTLIGLIVMIPENLRFSIIKILPFRLLAAVLSDRKYFFISVYTFAYLVLFVITGVFVII